MNVHSLVSPLKTDVARASVDRDRLTFAQTYPHLNHRVFRYPAKFHPPVVRALIEAYSGPGDVILDPFVGSGTTLVEGLVAGRSVIGTDVDPLAIFVSAAKVSHFEPRIFEIRLAKIKQRLTAMQEADIALWGGLERDIGEGEFDAAIEPLRSHVPALPRLHHWFRRRVVVQLAAIRSFVDGVRDGQLRMFLRLCFASTIRNSSNADPVPVSGLEVTSHMLRKEAAGRRIDPYALMITAIDKASVAQSAFQAARSPGVSARTAIADARCIGGLGTSTVDCVITSPPYLAAVDYYRRHTLEMYWLGLTTGAEQRLDIMPRYIGRDRVGRRHLEPQQSHGRAVSARWLGMLRNAKPERARAFEHYCVSMESVLERMAALIKPSGNVVFVVGDVRFSGLAISMTTLLEELAAPHLTIAARRWYPLANRYMSYSRKNEADINADHVLVFGRSR